MRIPVVTKESAVERHGNVNGLALIKPAVSDSAEDRFRKENEGAAGLDHIITSPGPEPTTS